MRRRRRDPSATDMPGMTPMLDIVFILLIFFIVAASFARESGLDVARPAVRSAPATAEPGLSVEILAGDVVSLDGRSIDIRRVRANLEHALAERPEAAVALRVHPSASNGAFVRVLDQARAAGARRVGLVPLAEAR